MRDRFFIDTNILIYFVSVIIKKKILSLLDTFKYAGEFMDIFEFSFLKKETIKSSFNVMRKYKYSYWDSLILASALENNCAILYTEDMKDGQLIEGKLKIVNPFKEKGMEKNT